MAAYQHIYVVKKAKGLVVSRVDAPDEIASRYQAVQRHSEGFHGASVANHQHRPTRMGYAPRENVGSGGVNRGRCGDAVKSEWLNIRWGNLPGLAMLAFFLLAASPLHADSSSEGEWLYEVSFGLLHHDTDNLWSGFRRESGVDLNVEALFSPIGDVLGGQLHPALGASVNTAGDTSKAYAGLRWRYGFAERFFVGAGLGAAVHDGETDFVSRDKKALGSRILFHVPLEIGFRPTENYSVSLYFDHVSNGFLADENEGMDTLGIRAATRF